MAETTSIWTWVSLGVGTVALFASVIVPGSIYFYDKSAAGVMAEDKLKKSNGAYLVEKQQEMANNMLNPANLFGSLKTAATAAATNMANKQISNKTGDALKRAKEIGGSSNTKGGLEIAGIQSPEIPAFKSPDMSDIQENIPSITPPDMSDIQENIPSITPPDMSDIQPNALNNINSSIANANSQFTSATKMNNPIFIQNASKMTRGLKNRPLPRVGVGGGRKTKNNRQKTVQPKVKKPRTKKCLITKGDKMFMSFCI
jgi:hypothetical protein